MSDQKTEAAERDRLLLRLLKTPPKPRPKRERADGPRFGKVEKRAVGPNDFGAPEDEVMDIITPFRVPEGIVFRNPRSGELTDSAGKSVPSPI